MESSLRSPRRESLAPFGVLSALVLIAAAAVLSLARGQPLATLLLIPPIVACGLALQSSRSLRTQRDHLDQLSAALREATSANALERGVKQLLGAANRLFKADYVEILLLPTASGERLSRSARKGDEERLLQQVRMTDADALAIEAVRSAGLSPVVVPPGKRDAELDRVLTARGLRDAIVGVLMTKRDVMGLVVVGNRIGDGVTFQLDDAAMFATFCGHASIVIENGRLEQSLEELTALKEQLRHQAFHDGLTGLPNRVLFTESVATALANVRSGTEIAGPVVLFLDLDDFKLVNDTWGHAAGDELLVASAQRLSQSVRPGDTPARLGGDEFAVLIEGATLDEGHEVADRIAHAFLDPFTVAGKSLAVRPSIGIAIAAAGMSAELLLKDADEAMYTAKSSSGRVARHGVETHETAQRRRQLGLELEGALDRHEIEVHFQPVVALEDGTITAFEALVRWAHPAHGLILPGDFLGLADNRQMLAIGRRVVKEACRHAALWQSAARPTRPIALWVNLSAVDLASKTFVEEVVETLRTSRLDPSLLMLEITENIVIMGEETAIEGMNALRAAGVRVAIDDFGTGYSSLSRLAGLPVDMLKIPKPFVDRLVDDEADKSLVDGILRLAGSLGLEIVAEGVESEAQACILRELECPLAQGYLYAPAVDGNVAVRLLGSGMRLPAEHGFRTMSLARQSIAERRVA